MQPYVGPTEDVQPPVAIPTVADRSERLHDLLNLLVIASAWILLLLLVPPPHEYPVMDDWIYLGSARDLFNTGVYTAPDWSQANLVGLVAWGVLWAKAFGLSVSILAWSVQFLALAGVIAFYGVLRQIGVRYWGALLGSLLLGFNPIYLHLSYSFMTDVPFISVGLLSCYCMLEGVKREATRAAVTWLVAGSLFAGWAFTIRQFGLVVPVAFLGYFILNGFITRALPWPRIAAIVTVTAMVLGGWYAWMHDIPESSQAAMANARAAVFVMQPPWPRVVVSRWLTYIPFTALFAVTGVRLRRQGWLLAATVLALMLAGMYLIKPEPEVGVAQFASPFTAQLGLVSVEWPQEEYGFGLQGSVVRPTGIDFDEFGYDQQQIWSPVAWRLLWLASVVAGALLLTRVIVAVAPTRWHDFRPGLPPSLAFYFAGTCIFLFTTMFQADVFLRYSLAFMPFVVLFVVRDSALWGRWAWTVSVATLALMVCFSVLAQADNMDHERARWQAGQWMEARTGAVRVGWNWAHWGHQESDNYIVDDVQQDNFRVEATFPYTSRLSGFATRTVLAQSRVDMPPLPEPAVKP